MASATRTVQLSVLCDDTAATEEYLAEHGVSILVELPNGHRWLMDTGTTDVFLLNARPKRVGMSRAASSRPMQSKLMAALAAFAFAAAAIAAPAPWYKWRSKLNGKEACVQTMQGEWDKVSGPYKDARCLKPGVPG